MTNLEPWQVVDGERLRWRYRGLAERYPDRTLVPFAERTDNDDVACWDLSSGVARLVVVHDFASSGWADRGQFDDFHSWFRQAVEDLIEFD